MSEGESGREGAREVTKVDVWRSRALSTRKSSSFLGANDGDGLVGLDESSVDGVAAVAGVRHRLASSEISRTLNAPSRCRRALPRRLCTTSTHASRIHDRRSGTVPDDRSVRSSCRTESALLYIAEATISDVVRSLDIKHDS